MQLTRRHLLATAAIGALAGCAGSGSGSVTGSTAAGAGSASGGSTSTGPATAAPPARAALPSTRPWTPRRGEVSPAVKRRATSLVEAVGTWSHGAGDLVSARARAGAAGFAPALADPLAPLLGTGSDAVVSVRDAQYGGILASSSSVLVVVDQWRLLADGTVHAGGTTLDVRLVAASPQWRVVAAYPADPGPAASGLTASARQVLDDARVRLPYAARSDVLAGRIHDSVLGLLLGLGDRYVVDVSILRSGHPLHVFGTSRTSDHPRGRAVDVWALDSRPLVLPTNHALAGTAMRYAVAHGAYNVGGPVLLGGPQYFSDATHQDHIHLGFDH